jgi:hypothetical protein
VNKAVTSLKSHLDLRFHIQQFGRRLLFYTPTFLEAFEFKGAPAAQKIVDAIEVLKGLTTANSRSLRSCGCGSDVGTVHAEPTGPPHGAERGAGQAI